MIRKPQKRHWPGKAPSWYKEEEDEWELSPLSKKSKVDGPEASERNPSEQIVDDRLDRLRNSKQTAGRRRREVKQTVVVSNTASAPKEEEKQNSGEIPNELTLAERRKRAREWHDEKKSTTGLELESEAHLGSGSVAEQKGTEMAIKGDDKSIINPAERSVDSEDGTEDDSDDSSDDEGFDDYFAIERVSKPIFKRKQQRTALAAAEHAEILRNKEAEAEKLRIEENKKASLQALQTAMETGEATSEDVKREKLWKENDINDLDSSDGDSEEEFNEWVERTVNRLQEAELREIEEAREAEETEARRELPDEEILREKILAQKDKVKGSKYVYMQRYYHKGAFYQDMDILERDYNLPTIQDMVLPRGENIPKVLQVKKYGLKGQTKYTHLYDQDTTRTEKDPLRDL